MEPGPAPGIFDILKSIRDEALVLHAEWLQGKLHWAGPSKPDPQDGYRIALQTKRRSDDRTHWEYNDNDFAKWVRGLGPKPTESGKMNCWEMVMFAGNDAGVIPKAWIDTVHAEATAHAITPDGYYTAIANRLNFGSAVDWASGVAVPRGNLVFFDRLEHVAVSTGNVVNGKHEVMSLWQLPTASNGNFNSITQRTTIEDLAASSHFNTIKYGANPW